MLLSERESTELAGIWSQLRGACWSWSLAMNTLDHTGHQQLHKELQLLTAGLLVAGWLHRWFLGGSSVPQGGSCCAGGVSRRAVAFCPPKQNELLPLLVFSKKTTNEWTLPALLRRPNYIIRVDPSAKISVSLRGTPPGSGSRCISVYFRKKVQLEMSVSLLVLWIKTYCSSTAVILATLTYSLCAWRK